MNRNSSSSNGQAGNGITSFASTEYFAGRSSRHHKPSADVLPTESSTDSDAYVPWYNPAWHRGDTISIVTDGKVIKRTGGGMTAVKTTTATGSSSSLEDDGAFSATASTLSGSDNTAVTDACSASSSSSSGINTNAVCEASNRLAGAQFSHHEKGSSGQAVVSLQRATKSYGKGANRKPVLDNINMTVTKGAIYGLLGASGCGKTTALSCIVGRRSLDDGRISVFGGVPGDRRTGVPGKRIGYMPQELALYTEFTIRETLEYFGRIYGLDSKHVGEQIKFLVEFLDLPKASRVIRTLSGGQQRRVSFAVSLLHNPELLILDEPTVGVDPMLRQSIWSHLVSLATEKSKTIIITTHYIEEARQATVVGLMRNGALLAEREPGSLLEEYCLPSLEDVFLKLCVRQTNEKGDPDRENDLKQEAKSLGGTLTRFATLSADGLGTTGRKQRSGNIVYPGITAMAEDLSIQPISYAKAPEEAMIEETGFDRIKRRLSLKKRPSNAAAFRSSSAADVEEFYEPACCQPAMPSPSKMWALVMKNLIKMWRNKSQLLFTFLLPAIQVIFFCVAIGRDPRNLPIAVVNGEIPFGENCTIVPGCDFSNLSCRLFDKLFEQDSLLQVDYPDRDAAVAAVRDGRAWGVINVPANFSKSLLKRLWSSIDADELTLNKSSITVELDSSNQQVDFVLQRSLHDGYKDFYTDLLSDCEFPEETGDTPLVFGDTIYGPKTPNFTDFMAPGIIILIIFFLALALTAEFFIVEQKDGLMDRSWVAGVLPSEYVISYVAVQMLVLVGQAAITLIFILVVFEVPCEGPVGWLIGLTMLQGMAGMCYGLFLSTLFTDLASSMQMSIGSFYPNLLLSGILWPVEGMPQALQTVAWYLPCTAACQAMRDVMARGWDIGRPSVYLGYVASVSWIAIFVVSAWVVIRIKST